MWCTSQAGQPAGAVLASAATCWVCGARRCAALRVWCELLCCAAVWLLWTDTCLGPLVLNPSLHARPLAAPPLHLLPTCAHMLPRPAPPCPAGVTALTLLVTPFLLQVSNRLMPRPKGWSGVGPGLGDVELPNGGPQVCTARHIRFALHIADAWAVEWPTQAWGERSEPLRNGQGGGGAPLLESNTLRVCGTSLRPGHSFACSPPGNPARKGARFCVRTETPLPDRCMGAHS